MAHIFPRVVQPQSERWRGTHSWISFIRLISSGRCILNANKGQASLSTRPKSRARTRKFETSLSIGWQKWLRPWGWISRNQHIMQFCFLIDFFRTNSNFTKRKWIKAWSCSRLFAVFSLQRKTTKRILMFQAQENSCVSCQATSQLKPNKRTINKHINTVWEFSTAKRRCKASTARRMSWSPKKC